MSPALIVLLPFVGAVLAGLAMRWGRAGVAGVSAAMTGLALIGLCLHIPAILQGAASSSRIDWLPQLGLTASFRIDGLGLLFGLLILGIGLLIQLYARHYLSASEPVARFYSFLMLFQGAMLGVVLSDNMLLLLVFWELTSLSSFLLIGFWSGWSEARRGARMALVVTGLGGLAMIAGMLILGRIAGSYEISALIDARAAIQASPLYLPALLLILLGAFTKSAQVPFHFWLPQAMAAPTPVSAYLHSATMVKAGVFLLARLWPVLSGTPEWFWIVSGTGLCTLLLGAWVALSRDDLKALLAYSTVSHLGLICLLLGLGTPEAALAAVFHIVNHAVFKAALFMSAGIVDHEAGTRSLARLGGLRRLMPVTFAIATLAALSMAGVPPLNGFLSKELLLESVLHAPGAGWTIGAGLAAALSVGYALRFVRLAFLGPVRDDYPKHPHDPGPGLWLAPALLAGLVVLVGLMPDVSVGWLVRAAAFAVTGEPSHAHLALWHGWTPALALSMLALVGGLLLALLPKAPPLPLPEARAVFDALCAAALRLARGLSDGLNNGSMGRALAFLLLAVLGAGVLAYAGPGAPVLTRPMLPAPPVVVACWLALMLACLGVTICHRNRLLALVAVGVVGLIVSGLFLYLSAPDLALTQITVEVVTVILLLMALNFLPRGSRVESAGLRRGLDAGLATLAGLGFGGLAWVVMRSEPGLPSISDYMLKNSYKLGGGDNVVNVILVDFRGYDTFGEITVLGIAALVIFALAQALLAHPLLARRRAGVARAGDHPLVLVTVTRLILPVMLAVGLHMFLRGHNLPGGGFVAGLIVAAALLAQYMASGQGWAQARIRLPYHALIGAGVAAAGLTGIAAWAAGLPFLTSWHGYAPLPGLEPLHLASAMGFDLGVFLCVLGAVMLALDALARLARAVRGTGAEEDRWSS